MHEDVQVRATGIDRFLQDFLGEGGLPDMLQVTATSWGAKEVRQEQRHEI